MVRPLGRVAVFVGLGILLSVCLAVPAAAGFQVPLYPPGPPYARLGPGGVAPNFWSASGNGNPQFFMSGVLFWWQNPPAPTTTTPPPDNAPEHQ